MVEICKLSTLNSAFKPGYALRILSTAILRRCDWIRPPVVPVYPLLQRDY
ncbi:hypothetical protein LINPERHAP1_LOCUS6026 [Linum perenne]